MCLSVNQVAAHITLQGAAQAVVGVRAPQLADWVAVVLQLLVAVDREQVLLVTQTLEVVEVAAVMDQVVLEDLAVPV